MKPREISAPNPLPLTSIFADSEAQSNKKEEP